jgi:hypothetical protein
VEEAIMSHLLRVNRKASDEDIIRLNSVGLSLATIAKVLGCHPTTITLRLRSLGVPPADTRRTFMEDVFRTLEPEEQEWLADQMADGQDLKLFIKNLLVQEYKK